MADLTDVNMLDAEGLRDGFEPLPPGEYQLFMESSDRVSTKAGDGELLKCVFIVGMGPHEGKKIFSNFNLWNKSTEAVRIAKSQWAAICFAALGQPPEMVRDSSMLNSKLFYAEISNVPHHNDPTKRSNEIVFSKGKIRSLKEGPAGSQPIVGQQLAAQQQQAMSAEAAPQQAMQAQQVNTATAVKPGNGKPPWAK